MSVEKSLEGKILEDITKTGFPTEILSGRTISARHWLVSFNPSYIDRKEGISREFDLMATQQWIAHRNQPSNQAIIGSHLIIDCKKSKNPWVFFVASERKTTPIGDYIKARVSNPLFYNASNYKKPLIDEEQLENFHHYFNTNKYARTYYEAFKGQETTQLIYKAVLSVTEAALFHQKQKLLPGYIGIYYPVIIFEGKMFEADIRSKDDIILTETQHTKINYSFIASGQSEPGFDQEHYRFLIDVVNIDYLNEFMDIIEKEQNQLLEIVEGLLKKELITPYKGDVGRIKYR